MPLERKAQTAAARRRPAAATVPRGAPAAARPPARTLQQRLGNHAAQALVARSIQLSQAKGLPAKVSTTHEAAELEAQRTARQVVRMRDPAPAAPAAPAQPAGIAVAQRAEAGPPARAVPASARVDLPGGRPLPPAVRGFMEPRFGASFANVRIHTGESAAQQSASLNAHAFTVGEHVFFGRNQFQPQSAGGRELIAHELTHTIQQGAAVQRSADTTVALRSAPRVQRLGLGTAVDYIAEHAYEVPGFRLLTLVLGRNPINLAKVDRSAANMLRALLELVPVAGPLLVKALDSYGIFEKAGAWADSQIQTLGLTASSLKDALYTFLNSLGLGDIIHPGEVWERAKRIFSEPVNRLIALGKSLVSGILEFVREAVVIPLAKLAEGTRGYDLLRAVLGEDPITREPVHADAETLIGGFMKLIGEEEVWENLQKAKAVPRAFAWFQDALKTVVAFVKQFPALFVTALKSLELTDLLLPPKAIVKIIAVFGGFALRFASWAGGAVWNLLEIIVDALSPGLMGYLRKTGAALKSILKNPMPFVLNLVKAAKLGFTNFADHFLEHLKAGLIDWLTGSLPSVYIPKAFTLPEIAKFAFSVLGLTWANIRAKLVAATSETAVKAMETGFDIVVTLVREGPAAAWDKIKEQLAKLQDMVIGGITDFIVDTVVKKAVPKLIAMFVPGAGFISAIVSIYETVMVFVRKISKIIQVATSFINSIVDIAGGAIDAAANRVESTLAGLLSLAISFLAGFAGLGNVAEKVMGVIEKVRAPIDKALDWLVNWIVGMAKKLFTAAKSGVKALIGWWKTKVNFTAGGESHTLFFQGEGAAAVLVVASETETLDGFLKRKASEAKDDKKKQDAIKEIGKLIEKVNTLKTSAAGKEAADDTKLQKDIEGVMNQIGLLLVQLLSDGDWGTPDNPVAFDYPKRRAEAYPTFYLATGTLKERSQEEKAAIFATQGSAPKSDRVYRYRPTESTPVPDQSKSLGLAAASQIEVGRKLFFNEKGTRGSGVAAFKKLVDDFGLVASKYDWDIDHVVELQLGGADEFHNMWPLPKGENRSSGAILKTAKVKVPGKKGEEEKSVEQAIADKKAAKKPQEGIWLLIKSTQQR